MGQAYPIASYAKLISEHAVITDRAEQLINAAERHLAGETRQALDALSVVLIQHLDLEDRELHPQLMASRDAATASAARATRLRYETLARDWRTLVDEWGESQIATDPLGFAAEAGALVGRLQARIDEENELLYPAALASGQLSLR